MGIFSRIVIHKKKEEGTPKERPAQADQKNVQDPAKVATQKGTAVASDAKKAEEKKKGVFSWVPKVHFAKREDKKGENKAEAAKGKIAEVGGKIKGKARKVYSNMPQYNFFSKMYLMVRKDISLLIRSKSSAIIFLLGPLVVFLLASMAFSTASTYSFKVSVFSESYSSLAENILSNLSSNYTVEKANTRDGCLTRVKGGDYSICIIFPPNMTAGAHEKKVEVYVDDSKRNIADFLVNEINRKFESSAEDISQAIVTEMFDVMGSATKQISDQAANVEDIKTKNADADTKTNSAVGDISSIDFAAPSFDSASVATEIDNVASNYNLSSNAVSTLRGKVTDMKNSYDSVKSKLSNANTKTTSAKVSIEEAQSSIRANAAKLKDVKEGLSSASANLSSLQGRDVQSIVSPISTEIKPLTLKQGNLFYTFPTIVLLLVTFFSMLMSATVVVREKDSKAYFRTALAPTHGLWFVVATYIANMLIISVQGTLIFALSAVLFKGFVLPLGISALVLVLVASTFIFLGTFVGYLFDSEETVMLVALCLSSIFIFFSNMILPLGSVSNRVLYWIIFFNPFVIGEKLIKWCILFGLDLYMVWRPGVMLILYCVLFFVLSLMGQRISRAIDKKGGSV